MMINIMGKALKQYCGFLKIALLIVFTVGFVSGCAGYKLGPVGGAIAGEKSVQVNPFVNQTIEPRLGEAVTSAVRKRIQTDGTFKLSTGGTADIILNGVITQYNRSPASFQPNDLISVRDYYVEMKVEITAVERLTGKVICNKTVTGRTVLNAGNDLSSSERQSLPIIAEDIARKVVSAIAEGGW
jgi:hypothetical protein